MARLAPRALVRHGAARLERSCAGRWTFRAVVLLGAEVAENAPKSLDEVDPKLLETYESSACRRTSAPRLAGVAVDAVFDSVSVGTTFRQQLAEVGVIFCSFSHAVQQHPELIERYLGSVVPQGDNFLPRSTRRCSPTALRLHPRRREVPHGAVRRTSASTRNTGQFERT